MPYDPAIQLGREMAADLGPRSATPEPWSRGIVQALVAGTPPRVTVRPKGMQDASADTDMVFMDGYEPKVNDVVTYGRISGSPFVLGRTKPDTGRSWPWKEITFPNNGDFSNASFADYITGFTNIPVPLWAQDGTAEARIVISSQGAIITGAGTFQLRVVAGSTNGTPSRIQGAVNTQFSGIAGITYTIPASTTSIAIKLQALMSAGSAIRPQSSANTIAVVDAVIRMP